MLFAAGFVFGVCVGAAVALGVFIITINVREKH
jgi:hypothetical protein